jgi:hypothetical protein
VATFRFKSMTAETTQHDLGLSRPGMAARDSAHSRLVRANGGSQRLWFEPSLNEAVSDEYGVLDLGEPRIARRLRRNAPLRLTLGRLRNVRRAKSDSIPVNASP